MALPYSATTWTGMDVPSSTTPPRGRLAGGGGTSGYGSVPAPDGFPAPAPAAAAAEVATKATEDAKSSSDERRPAIAASRVSALAPRAFGALLVACVGLAVTAYACDERGGRAGGARLVPLNLVAEDKRLVSCRPEPFTHELSNCRPDEALKTAQCVTVYGHTDGFGAQYEAVISGVFRAMELGIPFRHTRAPRVSHWSGDIGELETFLGIEADPAAAAECVGAHHFPEASHVPAAPLAQAIRKLYFKTSKAAYEPTDFGSGYRPADSASTVARTCTAASCDVVVHIRRGDRSDRGDKLGDRHYVSDSSMLNLLDRVHAEVLGRPYVPTTHPASNISGVTPRLSKTQAATIIETGTPIEVMKASPIRFHIYSEGTSDLFAPFTAWAAASGVSMRLHLNGDLRAAFHAMVVADALLYGPSSLPRLAAR